MSRNPFTIIGPDSDTVLICRGLNRCWNEKPTTESSCDDATTTAAEEEEEEEFTDVEDPRFEIRGQSTVYRDVTEEVHSIRDLQNLAPCENGATLEIWFYVSSSLLVLSSRVFARMMNGRWKEGDKNSENMYTITTTDWNAEALFILLNIIHGQHQRVPDYIDFNTIVELGRICDYYDCHANVKIFVDKWLVPFGLHKPTPTFPGTTMENITTWILIAWVFNKAQLFNELVEVALKNCRGPLKGHPPLPTFLIARVEAHRQHLMKNILDYVYTLHESLIYHPDICPQRCATLLLGNITKHIRRNGYNIPRRQGELAGKSWVGMKQFAQGIHKPVFKYTSGPSHECRFEIKTDAWWAEVSARVTDGCRFEDFKRLIH
ncbi:hypothetical protein NW768_002621 [Fusarium equiseti]|uniref:BTB domain-containing protein n=1 Tax=Fusarium equiseti TaxID=61235 RepID=A0ABQ8RP35_FUSEQ|nr:hypothetical protein NW768_002621 [Fusarium equiseti]